jgi:uncharacterized protein YbjT (DUF2867 family)
LPNHVAIAPAGTLPTPKCALRTRGEGELAVRDEFSGAVVVRPAVMFGPGDAFLSKFIQILRILPVSPFQNLNRGQFVGWLQWIR